MTCVHTARGGGRGRRVHHPAPPRVTGWRRRGLGVRGTGGSHKGGAGERGASRGQRGREGPRTAAGWAGGDEGWRHAAEAYICACLCVCLYMYTYACSRLQPGPQPCTVLHACLVCTWHEEDPPSHKIIPRFQWPRHRHAPTLDYLDLDQPEAEVPVPYNTLGPLRGPPAHTAGVTPGCRCPALRRTSALNSAHSVPAT